MRRGYIIHNKNHNCFDDIVAALALSENRDYQLMLSNTWRFEFNKESKKIGESIYNSSPNNQKLLRDVHGINFIYKKDIEHLKQYFYCYIEKYRYIAVNIDTFYCIWDKSYNQFHNTNHTVLCANINMKDELVYVHDPFYEKYNEKIDFATFLKAFNGVYFFEIHSIIEGQRMNIYTDVISDLMDTLHCINNINNFIKVLIDIDIAFERDGIVNIWHCPIMINLYRIQLNRLRYTIFLKYINQNTNINILNYIKELEEISYDWERIRNNIFKLIYYNDKKYLMGIINLINLVKDKEYNTCVSIIDVFTKRYEDLEIIKK